MQRAHRLLARCPLCPEHAWLAAFDAHHALMADKDPRTAQALAEQAASIAEALGAVDAEMMGRALEGLALVSQSHVREGMRLLDETTAAVVAGEVADLQAVGLTCCYMIYACERVWDYQRAEQWCDRVVEFCRRWHFTMLWAVCRTQYAGVLIWQGAWAEAESELGTAIRDLAGIRPALTGSATVRLGELRRRQGRWEEAAHLFRQVEASPGALLGRAELALDQGDAAMAVDLAQRYLRRFAPESRTEQLPALDVLVRAWVALGDLAQAQETLARLQGSPTPSEWRPSSPWSGEWPAASPWLRGSWTTRGPPGKTP